MPPLPDLVLLPGLLCDGDLWRSQIAGLAGRAACYVADVTGADTMGALAEAVLERAPARFALAGLSMGGYLAFEILRRAPARVAGLALLSTTARADSAESAARRRHWIELAQSGRFAEVGPALLPHLVSPDRRDDPAVAGVYLAMAARLGASVLIRQQQAMLGRPDSRPDLAAIRVPTLVLVGARDTLTPPDHAREIAGAIPGATLAVVPDCGHLSTLEQPDAVTGHLARWLGGAPVGQGTQPGNRSSTSQPAMTVPL